MAFGQLGAGFGRMGAATAAGSGGGVSPPVNTVAPVISGNVQVGQTLTTTDGTWSGSPTFTYQWKRAGIDIASATANTYVLVAADAGQAITCVVTGTNAGGNASATSNTLTIDIVITATDHAVSATDLTIYTFSARALGTASSNRKIIVGICGRPAPLVSSVTVAGVSAVEAISDVSAGSADRAAIWVADVPVGTTGDIVVTFASGVLRCGIGVYAMIGAGSSTPSATGSSAVNPSTATLNIPVHGSAMAHALGNGGTSATWTNLTEAFDEAVEGGIIQSGASANIPAGGNTALTCTWAAFVTGVGVFAAWGP